MRLLQLNAQSKHYVYASDYCHLVMSKKLLFSSYGTSFARMWYDEINDYDLSNPGFSMATGHFTQEVWKDTDTLGCGIGVASDNTVYGVCNYTPQGNIEGQFEQNVLSKD